MRFLVLCPHFEPDVAPTGVVISRLTAELAANGHELDVVTSLPWYRNHRIEPGWKGRPRRVEATPNGSVIRLHPFPSDKSSLPARALGFAGFTAIATLQSLLVRRRPDVVLAMSPPLTLGLAGWLAARRWRAPLIFNIQDVFPDVAIEVGALSSRRAIGLARRLERFCYRRADAVTVLSDDLRRNVEAKLARRGPLTSGRSHTRVVTIPNFVDTTAVSPQPHENSYRREHGLAGKLVVMYAGNLGHSQPFDLMLDAAAALADREDVVFVANGDGVARPALAEAAARLPNLRLVGYQPAERLAEVLAAADVHLILLKEGLAAASVPSKSYSILAAGRPVLAAVDPGTEVATMIDSAGAGSVVPPGDAQRFVAALERMLADPDTLREQGRSGREWVEGWASAASVAARYETLASDLTGPGRPGIRSEGR